jgi:hypothetical protein
VAALRRGSAAYHALARAARRGEARRYAGARRASLRADATLKRALRALRVAAYVE